jgi:hypothetical protein
MDFALHERLMAATAPDRALDGEILKAANPTVVQTYRGLPDYATQEHEGSMRTIDVPPYTDSIDAAVTLLPSPSWFWRVDSHDPSAWVYLNIQDAYKGEGKTPAISLCIAALKARSTLNAS